MSTSGHLKFQGTNRATFVGTTSNIMFDTTSTSLGIGVTGTDHPSSNLYVTGNAYVSSNIAVGGVLTMGTVNVVARHDLEAVTALGNTTPVTLEFTNPTTSLVASGNVVVTGNVTADHFVGDGSNITGISSTLQAITDSGPGANVTSNTVQFTNATTGFVTTANVEVGGELTVSGNVEVGTANLFVDTVNSRIGIGTSTPSKTLVVGGDVAFPQSVTSTDSHNTTDRALYIGGKDYNGSLTQAKCAIISSPLVANGGFQQYGRNSLHFCVGPDSLDDVNASVSNSRLSIDRSGNVGIGITKATQSFHVHKNLPTTSHQVMARIGGDTSSYNTLVFGSKEGRPHIGGHRGDFNAWADLSIQDDALIISQSGYVRIPSLPIASLSDSRSSYISNADLTSANFYNHTWLNNGNHFNASTGRFTCPVDGIYRIYFRVTATAGTNVRLRKDGGGINEAYAGASASGQRSVSSEAIVSCDANDYLHIQVSSLTPQGGTQHCQVTFQQLG